jgi:amino acid transporter
LPDHSLTGPPAVPSPSVRYSATRKVTLLGLIAATYFVVAGGPYGLEDVVKGGGSYLWAVAALLIVPFVWSLPTALMVSELSSALPNDGGYYVWVRRALGPFWGFQEAWLSLAASVFDMAIYPILFVTYLGFAGKHAVRFLNTHDLAGDATWWKQLADRKPGEPAWVAGLGISMLVIAACALSNLRGARTIGLSSVVLTVALLAPFGVLSVLAVVHSPGDEQHQAVEQRPADPLAQAGEGDEQTTQGSETPKPEGFVWITALLFAMWNYMGWDNASTIAGEVERPQRTYPLAMAAAVSLVTLTYVIPVAAASRSGIDPGKWEEGAWVDVGDTVGGAALAVGIGVGGMVMGYGMFNSLVLSYTRVPVALAEDGYLPAVFTRRLRNGAPWVAVVVCVLGWSLALQLGLKRTLALDVILYGLSLLLEFAALVALRVREPQLVRPFRVPGGKVVASLLGLCPALLLGMAIFDQAGKWTPEEGDWIAPAWALLLGAAVTALGPVVYFLKRIAATRSRRSRVPDVRQSRSAPQIPRDG